MSAYSAKMSVRKRIGDEAYAMVFERAAAVIGEKVCAACLKTIASDHRLEKLHVDHVYAEERGGCHHIHNLIPMCPKCNELKSNRPLQDAITEIVEKDRTISPDKKAETIGERILTIITITQSDSPSCEPFNDGETSYYSRRFLSNSTDENGEMFAEKLIRNIVDKMGIEYLRTLPYIQANKERANMFLAKLAKTQQETLTEDLLEARERLEKLERKMSETFQYSV